MQRVAQFFSRQPPKTYNILSIGFRGAGKTVFLAGSYTSLHFNRKKARLHQEWLDCQDAESHEKMNQLLDFITQSRQYPPPTLKATEFNFSVKTRTLCGVKTRCHLHWWDIPGEFCQPNNADLQLLLFSSHACCLLIDAPAFVNDRPYQQKVKSVLQQLANFLPQSQANRPNYPLAVILTKFDLLQTELSRGQLKQQLQPFVQDLRSHQINAHGFTSAIPLISFGASVTLHPQGTGAPFRWLITELNKTEQAVRR
ncbi:TRAFAC clade GTPase domain-containing protein [Acaryochloris marina]|uniref:Double-GTPase 2 domain-containing protein n=1 Tax=Acaryochloris marina (strain MBIC 11017) TaxID=329726 RepID=B0CDW0_ACAM1|nr:hypothetical protein [Acaryochloris marina]ABW29312.1 conserved hypothetical protein [Acaryochloris marina MBIC11017]BDM78235.1 hypothetical protein AM10699_11050 [Acaryochloris marina MBIC10699]